LPSRDLSGAPHTLADYRGKVVSDFWVDVVRALPREMPSDHRLKAAISRRLIRHPRGERR